MAWVQRGGTGFFTTESAESAEVGEERVPDLGSEPFFPSALCALCVSVVNLFVSPT
jgi:hypothetical protein